MDHFTPKLQSLPPAQVRLWPSLRPLARLGFVLYGGTAITLRLGHRASVDFDFFTDRALDKELLREAMPFLSLSTVLQDRPDTFTIAFRDNRKSSDQVKLSFFGGLGFGRVDDPELTEDEVAQVASFDDLMATKVKVILQRVEAKDYIDIAALVSSGVSLAKGLSSARLLFGNNFQPSESLKAMVYFKGTDLESLSAQVKKTLIAAVSAVRELPDVSLRAKTLALDCL